MTSRRGFTLIELLVVITILAVLATVAVPKFASLVRRANEGASRGKLSSLRTALALYYTDNDGFYPSNLTPMITPGSKYLTGIIPLYTYDHGNLDEVHLRQSTDFDADDGGWGYVNNSSEGRWGYVWVECTHTDMRGVPWTTY